MFSSEKILQEISFLLSLNGNKMNLLKLIKELYLIDRKSIEERDSSVSGDTYYSLKHGPILSMTLDMLTDVSNNNWNDFLQSKPTKYYPNIILKKEISDYDRLSVKDKEYIIEISEKFSSYNEFQLEDYTHKNLPEWKDPNGGSEKIKFRDIMRALGRSDEEIIAAKSEYEFISDLSDNRD